MEYFIEAFLIGVGLSMDAFAVSVCKGLSMTRVNRRHCLIIGLFFGGFQALMPFLGWLAGTAFADHVAALDHWIAFVLLVYIGGKMIFEALQEGSETEEAAQSDPPLDLKELLLLAIATSIDALAVGVTFAFSGNPILPSIAIIGVTTFVISDLLGGNKIQLIGNIIENEFTTANNWNLGAGLSLVLMIIILGSMALMSRYDKNGEGAALW